MRSALRFTGPTILHDMTFPGYSDKERAFLDKTHSAAMIHPSHGFMMTPPVSRSITGGRLL